MASSQQLFPLCKHFNLVKALQFLKHCFELSLRKHVTHLDVTSFIVNFLSVLQKVSFEKGGNCLKQFHSKSFKDKNEMKKSKHFHLQGQILLNSTEEITIVKTALKCMV